VLTYTPTPTLIRYVNVAGSVGEALSWTYIPSYQRQFNVAQSIIEVIGFPAPETRFAQTIGEVLTRTPPGNVAQTILEVLGTSPQTLLPLFADVVTTAVTQNDNTWPTLADTISTESLWTVWQYAIVQMPIDPSISYNIVGQTVTLAVLASPITAISYEQIKQAWSYAVQASRLGDYPLPDQMWSKVSTNHVSLMVLQSLDIPYVPTSGVFAKQALSMVVQAAPLPMYTTPASVGFNGMLVAQKRPTERLPRSNIDTAQQLTQAVTALPLPMHRSDVDAAQLLSQAVIPADFDEHTVGVEHAASVTSYSVSALPMGTPTGPDIVASYVNTVLQESDDLHGIPQSQTRVGTVTALVLRTTDIFPPVSLIRTAAARMAVTSAASGYLPPDELIVKSQSGAVRMAVTQIADDYPNPGIPTTTVRVDTVAILNAQPATYDSPEDIYERSRYQTVGQYVELVPQRRPLPLPISYAPAYQVVELVTSYLYMPPPDVIANSGIKVWQVTQPVARVAKYPDPYIPYSTLTVSQLLEQVAMVAEYPDVHLPTSDAIVNQLLEHVAAVDEFPDPGTMFRPLVVNQVIQQVSQETTYPDWSTLHKPVVVQQVIQQVSVTASYPDKDVPQSFVKITQVLEHVADKANYPDKNAPQSTLRVRQVFEQVMMRDTTMYVMPTPPRKHRVQISCRFVY
jgi:hypothetical protein